MFASERLTDSLLDWLTPHVHILEMNGEVSRLNCTLKNAMRQAPEDPDGSNSLILSSPLSARSNATRQVVHLSSAVVVHFAVASDTRTLAGPFLRHAGLTV